MLVTTQEPSIGSATSTWAEASGHDNYEALGDDSSDRPSETTIESELERLAQLQRKVWALPGKTAMAGWWIEEYEVPSKKRTTIKARWRYYKGGTRRSRSLGNSDSADALAARKEYRKRRLIDRIDLYRRHLQEMQRKLAEEAAVGVDAIAEAIAQFKTEEGKLVSKTSASNHREAA